MSRLLAPKSPALNSEKGVDIFNFDEEDVKVPNVPVTTQLKVEGKIL